MKISIIGAGNVGSTCALYLSEEKIADEIIVVDIVEGLAKGKMLDLAQATSLRGYKSKIEGTDDFSKISDSEIIVITAGLPRKPGMTREDLLKTNSDIVKSVCAEILKYSKNSLILVVTNPLDIMCYFAMKTTGFLEKKVIGMGGILDTARFKYFISKEVLCHPSLIDAIVIGAHNDEMVTVVSSAKVQGKYLTEILSDEKIKEIVKKTKYAGAEIVSYLKTGSAYFSPAASIVEMIKKILNNEKEILPTSCYLNGEYGESDIYCGVPARLSLNGVEEIIEINLTDDEKQDFKKSVNSVREGIKIVDELMS